MRVNNSALLSYDQIAKRLGISAMRVRQIEQRALKKLKVGLRKVGVHSSSGGDFRDSGSKEAEHKFPYQRDGVALKAPPPYINPFDGLTA